MKLREEIARSRQTVDNDPFQITDIEDVHVEMGANDDGKWSVTVSCISNPSLSFPTRSFELEHEANHYARDCAYQIQRKTMNERKRIDERYSLTSNIYDSDNVLTEGLLEWIAGLIGMLIQGYQTENKETVTTTTKELEKVASSRLTKFAIQELGEDVGSKIKKFDDLDLKKTDHRKVLFLCQADKDFYSKKSQEYKQAFAQLDKIERWFPPEGDDAAKEWSEKEGKVIASAIYAYGGFTQGELTWWAPYFGSQELKALAAEAEGAVKRDDLFGSAFKWLGYIKDKLNEKCISTWNYALTTVKVEEAKVPLQFHKDMLGLIDKYLPILKKASEEKAKDAPDDVKNQPDGDAMELLLKGFTEKSDSLESLVEEYMNLGKKLAGDNLGKLASKEQVESMEQFFSQDDWKDKFEKDIKSISNFGTDMFGDTELSARGAFLKKYKELSKESKESGSGFDLEKNPEGRMTPEEFESMKDTFAEKKAEIVAELGLDQNEGMGKFMTGISSGSTKAKEMEAEYDGSLFFGVDVKAMSDAGKSIFFVDYDNKGIQMITKNNIDKVKSDATGNLEKMGESIIRKLVRKLILENQRVHTRKRVIVDRRFFRD